MAKRNTFVGVNLGNHTLIIRNPREVMGHDDSLPYNAEFAIFHNDKEVARGEIWNDGWGGMSGYRAERRRNPRADFEVDTFDKVCKERARYKYKGMDFDLGFTEVVDMLVPLALSGRVNNRVLDERVFIAYLNAA